MPTTTPLLIHFNFWEIAKGTLPWTWGFIKFIFLAVGWKIWLGALLVLILISVIESKSKRIT
jgi:hypothetical protein